MGNVFSFPWEIGLMQTIQRLGSVGERIGVIFTLLGEDLLLIAVLGFLYWGINKQWARSTFTRFALASLCGSMIKNVVKRRRPYMDHEEVRCARLPVPGADPQDVATQGFSCPSLHAAHTMAIYGSLAVFVKKRWFSVLMGVLMLLVGYSRIILGVHYPTDVLLGWCLGVLAIIVGSQIDKRVKHPLIDLAIIGILALPGWFFCVSNDFYTMYGLIIGMYFSFWVDDKYIRFKETKRMPRRICRTVIGVALFFLLSTVTKLPFPKELLEGSDFAAHMIRVVRYALCSFIVIGLYPALFPVLDRIVRD